jgi:hypothetical protein
VSDFDVFGDYEPEQPATLEEERPQRKKEESRQRERQPGRFYNFVSFVFLLATVAVLVVSVLPAAHAHC